MLDVKITGEGLRLTRETVEALGDQAKLHTALTRALNKTGQMAFTRVKRSLAKQMGTTQAQVVRYGEVRRIPAKKQFLETRITSKGKALPTKVFGARQTGAGVSASPWGGRRIFPGTFMVQSRGGHVFKNTGEPNRISGRNNAIEKHWGPSVPRELVQGESEKAFRQVAERVLEPEIARQINLLTNGAFR